MALSLEDYNALPWDEKRSHFDSLVTGKRQSMNKPKTGLVEPEWLPTLYCDLLFPTFTSLGLRIEIGKKLLNGTIRLVGDNEVLMIWVGYASQVYDGQLRLCKVDPRAYITGAIDGVETRFVGSECVMGKWPGFLVLFE